MTSRLYSTFNKENVYTSHFVNNFSFNATSDVCYSTAFFISIESTNFLPFPNGKSFIKFFMK